MTASTVAGMGSGWIETVNLVIAVVGVLIAVMGLCVSIRLSRQALREARVIQEREWAWVLEDRARERERTAERTLVAYHERLWWCRPDERLRNLRDAAFEAANRLADVREERATGFLRELMLYEGVFGALARGDVSEARWIWMETIGSDWLPTPQDELMRQVKDPNRPRVGCRPRVLERPQVRRSSLRWMHDQRSGGRRRSTDIPRH